MRPGLRRDRLTAALLGLRAPYGPVTPVARRIVRYVTMGASSSPAAVDVCARMVHACPRKVRHAWAHVLGGLDLDRGVRELTVPTAVIVGTADRMTPPVQARALVAALPHCAGSTELTGVGHMAPVEAPDAVNRRIRELVDSYVRGGAVRDPGAGLDDELEEAGA